MPGDLIFVSGTVPLLWMPRGAPSAAARTAPLDESGASVEAPLFTEVLRAASPLARGETGGGSSCTGDRRLDTPRRPGTLALPRVTYPCSGWGVAARAMAKVTSPGPPHAHKGFEYDPGLDRYECPQESPHPHTYDDRNKLAIYRAPASSCNGAC